MKNYKITVLAGDGIGPEITAEAVAVLKAVAARYGFNMEFDYRLIGGAAIDAEGEPLTAATVEACKCSDAVLLGAVGGSKWDGLGGEQRPEAGLLGIRRGLSLYANLRPARIFSELCESSPLKTTIIEKGVDVLVVRELTGGIYFGERGRIVVDGEDAAYDTELYRVSEIERIARVAFDAARKRARRVTSVDKANILESSRLWRETVIRVAGEYPDVELRHLYVDNCSMQLVRDPAQFDVILTSNMFGDILSDEAAMISGSIGMLASASLGDGGPGLFEPVHGSAPDIAGRGIANPCAAILSAAMLLKYSLGEERAAADIENAVEETLAIARTPDIAGEGIEVVTTRRMGELVVSRVRDCSATAE